MVKKIISIVLVIGLFQYSFSKENNNMFHDDNEVPCPSVESIKWDKSGKYVANSKGFDFKSGWASNIDGNSINSLIAAGLEVSAGVLPPFQVPPVFYCIYDRKVFGKVTLTLNTGHFDIHGRDLDSKIWKFDGGVSYSCIKFSKMCPVNISWL